ncbi:DUF262 domain-containing protein [Aliarcobacter butzleri]|nr:DUF262 domain-containing protein [Aliarcobacter butzleri]
MEDIEIENEKIIDDNIVSDVTIINPFSTKDIKVTNATIALSSLINRLEHNEIDLNPEFQRNDNLWNRKKMSRLIESILLKLPLPVFYFDVTDPSKWIVVDGLQRLSTLKKFIVDKKLKLYNLEFLTQINDKKYEDLDRSLKRVIDETQIVTYQIEAQTPKEVRYSIFNRINTGGLSLNAQEIRQALNQKGQGVNFLKEICENDIFKKVVGISSQRMADRELALRFIAFKLTHYTEFKVADMGTFLDNAMDMLDKIDDLSRLDKIKHDFFDSLIFSEKVLGRKHRFSRSLAIEENIRALNRSLFDVISVCFSEIEDKNEFLLKKEKFVNKFKNLLLDQQGEFSKSITEGTSGKSVVEMRFRIMNKLINEVLNDKN